MQDAGARLGRVWTKAAGVGLEQGACGPNEAVLQLSPDTKTNMKAG